MCRRGKNYRQILIQSEQDLKLILWRKNPSNPIGIYRLNTVTYGTASAPYLIIRCLNQLARDCEDEQVVTVIREDTYVDDVLMGDDNLSSLFNMCEKVTNILNFQHVFHYVNGYLIWISLQMII